MTRPFFPLTAALLLLAPSAGAAPPGQPAAGKVIIGYLFVEDAVIDPATIRADELTHVNYAFADVRDGKMVEGFAHDRENLAVLTGLRAAHPQIRILVSVGGWTWSGAFSDAALTEKSRRRFVKSAVSFVRRHDLDGLDVDWEYPGLPGIGNVHRPEDQQNFTLLLRGLRSALDAEGRRRHRPCLLTIAAGADQSFLEHTEMSAVQGIVDYVNLMTYDFREAESEPTAGHHANLHASAADPAGSSAERSVDAFLAAGVPAGKLVLGVPFYGHAWEAVETTGDPLYHQGRAPTEKMSTHYDHLAALAAGGEGYERRWDAAAQAPYLWNAAKRVFISYDDPESLRAKARFLKDRGLAGVMFWEYSADTTGALLGTLARELR